MASDACNLGLGAVLLHKEKDGQLKAVHHVSRTLLQVKINYSQIEKERLGLIFAVKKFHKYIHGREFILQTDHCPLLSIIGSKKEFLHIQLIAYKDGEPSFKTEFLPSKKIPWADGYCFTEFRNGY